MKKTLLLFGLFACLFVGNAQEKVKTPVVQSVGIEILPLGVLLEERTEAGDFYSKGDLIAFYERGGRFRFRGEAGVSLLSFIDDDDQKPTVAPNASIAFGYRLWERSDMRSYFTGYLGIGTQYAPDMGLNRKLFLDLHFVYYLTNRLGVSALARMGNYNMSNAMYLLGGAGLTYTF